MNATAHDTIVQEIVIAAPAERVFAAIIDPQQRVQWWGVAGKFQTTSMESDLRPSGNWSMSGIGGGKPFTIHGEYRVVERPRLIEFTWTKNEEPITIVRFELTEVDGSTTVRLTHSGLTDQLREQYQGWPWLMALLKGFAEAQSDG
ncbi:MAG: SRPBCC domain-containing protein [Pirellulales bacterium]